MEFPGKTQMEPLRIGRFSLALIAVALLVIASPSCAARGLGSAGVDDVQEIRLLETRLREAAVVRATAVLNELLADDYTNINAYGSVRNKARVIADIESGGVSFEEIDLDDISVRLFGNVAVLTAKRTVKGRADRDPSGEFRQLRVWAKRQGRWQAVMLQITRIAE